MVERFTGGTDYPYDLWCLIGDYIEPECVAKFAVICKTSYTVVNTARFWSKLYQRYFMMNLLDNIFTSATLVAETLCFHRCLSVHRGREVYTPQADTAPGQTPH